MSANPLILPADYGDWLAGLRAAFQDMKCAGAASLKYRRFFAQERPDRKIGQQSAAQLPGGPVAKLFRWFRQSCGKIGQRSADRVPWFHVANLPGIGKIETELSRDFEKEEGS